MGKRSSTLFTCTLTWLFVVFFGGEGEEDHDFPAVVFTFGGKQLSSCLHEGFLVANSCVCFGVVSKHQKGTSSNSGGVPQKRHTHMFFGRDVLPFPFPVPVACMWSLSYRGAAISYIWKAVIPIHRSSEEIYKRIITSGTKERYT